MTWEKLFISNAPSRVGNICYKPFCLFAIIAYHQFLFFHFVFLWCVLLKYFGRRLGILSDVGIPIYNCRCKNVANLAHCPLYVYSTMTMTVTRRCYVILYYYAVCTRLYSVVSTFRWFIHRTRSNKLVNAIFVFLIWCCIERKSITTIIDFSYLGRIHYVFGLEFCFPSAQN